MCNWLLTPLEYAALGLVSRYLLTATADQRQLAAQHLITRHSDPVHLRRMAEACEDMAVRLRIAAGTRERNQHAAGQAP